MQIYLIGGVSRLNGVYKIDSACYSNIIIISFISGKF